MDRDVILDIRGLSVRYRTRKGAITPVDNLSLQIREGECLGIAGESGCGKSTMALAVMRLLPVNARITAGSILLKGEDLVPFSEKEYARRIWGRQVIMISQNPHDALNPVFRVRDQLREILWVHEKSKADARTRLRERYSQEIEEILSGMGIPDISRVLDAYPHQLSGGMKQRILTAMAFFCNPYILIADEPTTALDTTIAAQVIEMFKGLMKTHSTSLIYISHDLALLSELSTSIAVMYAGEIVEYGKTTDIVSNAMHPYTTALLAAIPSASKSRLDSIPGKVPDLSNPFDLCRFNPRCREKGEWCMEEKPELLEVEPGHWARCSKFSAAGTNRSTYGSR